jgi:hypothetical protein
MSCESSSSDDFLLTPEQPVEEGCPVLGKRRTILAEKGVCIPARWTAKGRSGSTVDFSPYFSANEESASVGGDGSAVVRFGSCDGFGNIYEIDAEVTSPTSGWINFTPPSEVINTAGLYRLGIGVKDSDDNIVFQENGLFSVEPTLFGDTEQRTGPPTIGELRVFLRDSPQENELLGDYEFDPTEILHAIVQPVMQWNETPPPVARFNCATFPFAFHWRQAIIGELLRIAANNYMRNEYQANHGGISGNYKAKHRQYLELAELYSTEWRRFIRAKKAEINAGLFNGSSVSPYSSGW